MGEIKTYSSWEEAQEKFFQEMEIVFKLFKRIRISSELETGTKYVVTPYIEYWLKIEDDSVTQEQLQQLIKEGIDFDIVLRDGHISIMKRYNINVQSQELKDYYYKLMEGDMNDTYDT